MEDEYLTINTREIRIESKKLDIFDVSYYPENPRINYLLSKLGPGVKQDDIDKNLWSLDATKELAADIEQNGGLIEAVMVYNGQVIEGNSRLCAYRHLYMNASDAEKPAWRKIMSKIITDKISESELFQLLGQYHLKGKTPWDPFEKASYINKMLTINKLPEEDVAKAIGMRPSSVKNQIKAYQLMKEKYLPKISAVDDEKAELKKFSIFDEFYKNSELQSMTENNADVLNEDVFIDWVREGRIRSAAYDVRKDLVPILRNKQARNAFLIEAPEDAIASAKEIVYKDHPEYTDDLYALIKKTTQALKDAKIIEVKQRLESTPSAKQLIRKLHSETTKFYRNLGITNEGN